MGGSEGIWNEKKKKKERTPRKQYPGTKLETSEIKMVWWEEHKGQPRRPGEALSLLAPWL